MDRRQAVALIGSGCLAFAGRAGDDGDKQGLKVSVAIPELFDTEGKLALAPTLRNAGHGLRFFVVIENVSSDDVFIWAEGNSEGHGTLSFELEAQDGTKATVTRVEQVWSKNIPRAVRLVPGGQHVRAVDYDPPAGKAADWTPFPFGKRNAGRVMTLRAAFEQAKSATKLKVWAGRVTSPACKVVLLNA